MGAFGFGDEQGDQMKLYGIYRGDKRIKRYGLHKTAEKAVYKFCRLRQMVGEYALIEIEPMSREIEGMGYSIKVAAHTN